MSKTPKMTVSSATVVKAALKRSFGVLKLTLAILILLYIALALTVVRVIPGVPGGAGLVLSKEDNYYGNIIPVSQASEVKEKVVIDLAGNYEKNSLLDRFKISFVPNANTAIVEVHAGPTGKLEWVEPNLVFVNGKQIEGFMNPVVKEEEDLLVGEEMPDRNPFAGAEFLNDYYLGVCVSGACAEGQIIPFEKSQVMGIPIAKIG